ncbi:hypothetical protein CU098_006010 [Rhizopus stolonifer]|uniref:Uncharacterized protein n=1 Tax=Rhizopus stolonifer TaxID=4846 RepID=A0A367J7H6_RHIST|nr:hypothetical protein CU098_006010 [Rhizopus stolonifer]
MYFKEVLFGQAEARVDVQVAPKFLDTESSKMKAKISSNMTSRHTNKISNLLGESSKCKTDPWTTAVRWPDMSVLEVDSNWVTDNGEDEEDEEDEDEEEEEGNEEKGDAEEDDEECDNEELAISAKPIVLTDRTQIQEFYGFSETENPGHFTPDLLAAADYYNKNIHQSQLMYGSRWLIKATGKPEYLQKANSYCDMFKSDLFYDITDWSDQNSAALVSTMLFTKKWFLRGNVLMNFH